MFVNITPRHRGARFEVDDKEPEGFMREEATLALEHCRGAGLTSPEALVQHLGPLADEDFAVSSIYDWEAGGGGDSITLLPAMSLFAADTMSGPMTLSNQATTMLLQTGGYSRFDVTVVGADLRCSCRIESESPYGSLKATWLVATRIVADRTATRRSARSLWSVAKIVLPTEASMPLTFEDRLSVVGREMKLQGPELGFTGLLMTQVLPAAIQSFWVNRNDAPPDAWSETTPGSDV